MKFLRRQIVSGFIARKDIHSTGVQTWPLEFNGPDRYEYHREDGPVFDGPIYRNLNGPEFWGEHWPPVRISIVLDSIENVQPRFPAARRRLAGIRKLLSI